MSKERRRLSVGEGLANGLKRADVRGMAEGLGEGLVRVSEAWLPKGKLAVPQACAVPSCPAGPFSSLSTLREHLVTSHPILSDRERSYALDQARRTAVQQAMNGARNAP